MAVQAALVAAIPQVDLERVEHPAPESGKIADLKQGQGIPHGNGIPI